MRKDSESGAIVVEATISLTAFVFAIFTILSVVNICYIQARISSALDSAAKEIAQYSYLYFKMGLDKKEAELNKGTEEARETTEDTVDQTVLFMNALSDANNSASTLDFDGLKESINVGSKSVETLYHDYADKLADHPKEFIMGFAKLAGVELKEELKVYLAQVMAKGFMAKNLKAFKDDNPDAFLKRYRVVDGLNGLDFDYSALMAYGKSNKIQLVCTYDVQVIKLLNIDFKFKFRQIAKTNAWGNGISALKPDVSTGTVANEKSVWDYTDVMRRGKMIVYDEKKNFTYTDSGNGFDAYDNKKNEFVTIVSHNTHEDSLNTSGKIKNQLRTDYNNMYGKVSELGETISVEKANGDKKTFKSDPETRTYNIRLVVPDDADMKMVNQAKAEFENEMGGNVHVTVVTGYGSPSPPKEDKEKTQK